MTRHLCIGAGWGDIFLIVSTIKSPEISGLFIGCIMRFYGDQGAQAAFAVVIFPVSLALPAAGGTVPNLFW